MRFKTVLQGSKRASFLWPGPAQRGPAKVVARPARSNFSAARPEPGPWICLARPARPRPDGDFFYCHFSMPEFENHMRD